MIITQEEGGVWIRKKRYSEGKRYEKPFTIMSGGS
jgi:hypothetical protein